MQDRADNCQRMRSVPPTLRCPSFREIEETEVKVKDIMTEAIISASPEEPFRMAIEKMSEHNISCVVVTEGEKAVGILTQRDVLKAVAAKQGEFAMTTVGETMSSPVISVAPDLSTLEASELMAARGIKRLLVVLGEQLRGIVTQTNINQSLISMCRFKNISEVMTTKLVKVGATTTIVEAARRMACCNISSVIVWHRAEAVGIVTERDILQKIIACDGNPIIMPVAEIMSFPVVTVPLTCSLMSASQKMHEMHIHRLLVGNAKQVEGIVTQTDLIAAVRRKLGEARDTHLRCQSEISEVADMLSIQLSSVQDLLRRPRTSADGVCGHLFVSDCDSVCTELQTQISELQGTWEKLLALIQGLD